MTKRGEIASTTTGFWNASPRWIATAVCAAVLVALAVESAQAAGCPATEAPGNLAALTQGIQRELVQHGFDPGSFDGVLGGRTRAQIRAYQRAARLKIDGCPSKELLDHLSFAVPKITAPGRGAPARTLETEVQEQLSRLGYFHGRTDGIAGAKTTAAVRAFQADNGMEVTGRIDSLLLSALKDGVPRRPGR